MCHSDVARRTSNEYSKWLGKYFRHTHTAHIHVLQNRSIFILMTIIFKRRVCIVLNANKRMQRWRASFCTRTVRQCNFLFSKLNRNFISLNDSGIFTNVLFAYFPVQSFASRTRSTSPRSNTLNRYIVVVAQECALV